MRKILILILTLQGVAMLSGILNSPRAIETNIAIMRTFVALRKLMEGNKDLAAQIEIDSSNPDDDDLKQIFAYNLYWKSDHSILLYPSAAVSSISCLLIGKQKTRCAQTVLFLIQSTNMKYLK